MKTTSLLLAVSLLGSACSPAPGPADAEPEPLSGEALIKRGEYLVVNVMGCNDCHTPMTPTGPDMSQSLHGADLAFGPVVDMPWAPHAPELAGLAMGYTFEEMEHFLQTGEKSTGGMATPPMPAFRLNEDDARATAAYIASLPPAE